MKEFMGF